MAARPQRPHSPCCRWRGRRVRACSAHRRRAAAEGGAQHIRLGDAPRGTAAGHVCEIHALDRRGARGHRGDLQTVGCPAGRHRGRGAVRARGAVCARGAVSGEGRALLGPGTAVALRLGGACPVHGDAGDHLPDGHRLALLDQDLADRSGRGRRQLEVDLVRGDLDDRVVELDRVANLHMPFKDGSLGDRLASGRGDDVDCLLCSHPRMASSLSDSPAGGVTTSVPRCAAVPIAMSLSL